MSDIILDKIYDNFYSKFLQIELNSLKDKLATKYPIFKKTTILVSDEQFFIQQNKLDPNTIYVACKKTGSTIVYSTLIQPYQISVISEENSMKRTQLLFNQFANENNFKQIELDNNIVAKEVYSEPVVIQTFTPFSSGLRSVLYINSYLYITQNIMDLKDLYIDDKKIDFIDVSISYGANFDTVQYAYEELANSIKTSGALTLSLTIACQESDLIKKALNMMMGKYTEDDRGNNTPYKFSFTIGNLSKFENIEFRLQNCAFGAAINDIPSITLSFMR